MTKILMHSLALTLALLATMAGPAARAAEVTGLYQATLPVDSREDQRQRSRAFAAGMQEVLVKLTGHVDIATAPGIQEALRSPQPYVESWAYQTRPDPRTQVQHLSIDLNFYPADIQRLLNDAGIGLWPPNRIETLVWMIIQDEKGERVLADANAGTGVAELQSLATQGAKFGLPGHAPLWDLEDQSVMTAELLWSQDEATLREASRRYQYESILAMRVVKLVTGQVVAKAVHIFRDHVHENEVLEGTLDDFFKSTAGMVAKELSDNYAVRMLSKQGESGRASQLLLLSVEDVHSISDYAAVQHYLQTLPGISDVHVREVNADTLTFSLNAAGQVRQLVENLAVDRKLQALQKPGSADSSHLHYRWQAQ